MLDDFSTMRNVVVHETTDPNKILVEYELVLTTGEQRSALFIAVLEVRDGLMALWREYLAIDEALDPAAV